MIYKAYFAIYLWCHWVIINQFISFYPGLSLIVLLKQICKHINTKINDDIRKIVFCNVVRCVSETITHCGLSGMPRKLY